MNEMLEKYGFGPGDILLPKGEDLSKWSVVACDQYTSEPEYWARVENRVGDAPSTLHLILPENRLGDGDTPGYIDAINAAMQDYLDRELFRVLPQSFVYVERWLDNGKLRRGLMGVVDLEAYDFTPGSDALIRATEGTVLSRIPPRVEVRRNAVLELPHIMLLLDDPQRQIIEPLTAQTDVMQQVYDFDLMERGGHITGYVLNEVQTQQVSAGLAELADPDTFAEKYDAAGKPVLLFAVGDGNHSLATAKACYEEQKDTPAGKLLRYALVELTNLHDESLEFEPIHRVCFNVDPEKLLADLTDAYPGAFPGTGDGHTIHYVYADGEGTVTVAHPSAQLPVGTLQSFLDRWLETNGGDVDYIHGEDVTRQLASQKGNIGFLLPPMGKDELFKTVINDGVLPRKTFSMGEANDKRFYLECRKIR